MAFVDPEELRRQQMWAQAIQSGTASPAPPMRGPYQPSPEQLAAAGQDFSGADRRIARMQQYANALRQQQMPQGRTVGPSNVYVGPNWGESLAYGINQAMGGLMQRRANKQSEALDEKRRQKQQAVLEIEDLQRQEVAQDRMLGRALQQRQMDQMQDQFETRLEDTQEARKQERALEAQKEARKEAIRIADREAEMLTEAGQENMDLAAENRERARDVLDRSRERMHEAQMEQMKGRGGSNLTAKQKNDMTDLDGAIAQLDAFSTDLGNLDEKAREEFGNVWSVLSEYAPDPLKNYVEKAFSPEVQDLRARAAFLDNYIREAVTTGVLSNQDVKNLKPMALSGTPSAEQIEIRAAALNQLLVDKRETIGSGGTWTSPATPSTGSGRSKKKAQEYDWSSDAVFGGETKREDERKEEDPLGLF